MKATIIIYFLLIFVKFAHASEGVALYKSNIDIKDIESIRRGFKHFTQNCLGCHGTEIQRYNRIEKDLDIEDIKEINPTIKKINKMTSNIDVKAANQWFGVKPPDLTLTAKIRSHDWIYSYLKSFYIDKERPFGVNNLAYPKTAMPNVLEEYQGINKLVKRDGGLILVKKTQGKYSDEEYNQMIRDITNFLEYSAEPIQIKRRYIGIFVLIFLILFTTLAWLLKQEYWKDIDKNQS